MAEQVDSPEALQVRLAEMLVKGPLYRQFVYHGTTCHKSVFSSGTGSTVRYGSLPSRLKMFCANERCKQETWWETDHEDVYFGREFIYDRRYTCRNCGKSQIYYHFIWQEKETNNIFLKVGQYPELEERVPDNLEQALSTTDLKLYKNAIRMRNFNLGLAGVAYMRRVIENKMTDMLEILHEAGIAHNAPKELLARHEEMKKEKRFSARIDYAGDLLPASLRPPGKPNPMAILHELASDGVHAKSDEECVEIFDKCRRTFEYVFGKLRIEIEEARAFIEGMADLAERKTKGGAAE